MKESSSTHLCKLKDQYERSFGDEERVGGAYRGLDVVVLWMVGVSCAEEGSLEHGLGLVSSSREGEERSQTLTACGEVDTNGKSIY